MASSLRDLIRKPVRRKALEKFLDSSAQDEPENLRAAVITWAAFIDVGMERLLRSRIRRNLNSDDENALFGSTGSLSGFAAKVRMAYALGIIGPMTKKDLLTINDIRNLFAHAPHNITMSNHRLWGKVQTLMFVKYVNEHKGFTYETIRKRVANRSRGAGLMEAMTGYALMLLYRKPFPRKLLPPAKAGRWLRFRMGNTLRF
jgi:DNA-binding MltR family transcriptional regulator